MFANDAVRHEEAKSSAALLRREVRLEQMVANLIRNTGAIV
jgi:C4-dicarboxylate-specific signal transduction histidine kinase